jgi:hypothetical protein
VRYLREDHGHVRIATLDIETTHYRPEQGEIVSVGVGVHDRGEPGAAATLETFHRDGSGEATLVRRALEGLEEYGADALVTYNGLGFDLPFIEGRLDRLGATVELPSVAAPESHVDLFVDRKRSGRKWPSLEECLDAYGLPRPSTIWNGEPVTGRRFGEELGPAFLGALTDDPRRASTLESVVDHYLTTDLEANLAIYYADIGEDFEPSLLGTEREF